MCQRVTWEGRHVPENYDWRRHNKHSVPFGSHHNFDKKEIWKEEEGKRPHYPPARETW